MRAASSKLARRRELKAHTHMPTNSTSRIAVKMPLKVPESIMAISKSTMARISHGSSVPLLRGGSQPLQIRDQRFHLALAVDGLRRAFDIRIGVRHANLAKGAQLVGHFRGIDLAAREERVRRHVRFGHDIARIDEMHPVPLVAIATADARQVRARALRAELERMVVHGFTRHRVM